MIGHSTSQEAVKTFGVVGPALEAGDAVVEDEIGIAAAAAAGLLSS